MVLRWSIMEFVRDDRLGDRLISDGRISVLLGDELLLLEELEVVECLRLTVEVVEERSLRFLCGGSMRDSD